MNANTFHTFFFRTNQIQLGEITNGTVTIISSGAVPSMTNRTVRLEVLIEGRTIAYRVDGLVPSDVAPVTASRDIPNTAGFYLNDNNARLTSFEVQPQSVPIPAALRVAAPAVYAAHAPTITDTFDGTGALGSPYVRTRGDETATRSGGVLSAGVVSGEDLHYVRPFSGTTIDLFLDFTAPGSSMGDGQGCMATVLAEGDALTVACRAYIQDAQIGNTELEIMSHTAPGVYAITNRVAMALELTKGARQNIRLIYDQAKNFYVAFYRGEPVMTGKLPLPPVVSAVGVGFGATDTGSTFDTFSAGSSNA